MQKCPFVIMLLYAITLMLSSGYARTSHLWIVYVFFRPLGDESLGKIMQTLQLRNPLILIKYLVERGCPWDSSVCTRAVEIGDLNLLKYLHEKGCPWDAETFAIAKHFDNKEIITYLEREGCPIDNSIQIRILNT